jgi:5-methylcytosine-specific restriction protein A
MSLRTLPARVQTLSPRLKTEGAESRYGQGRGGRPWRRLRNEILRRDGFLCQPCKAQKRTKLATEVDHIVPMFEGGSDAKANLQAICTECHAVKTKAEAHRARS